MPDIFDQLRGITDQAWRFGKRLSKDDPLGPHDVADRLDKACARVWKIILTAEEMGPEFSAEVIRSRYTAGGLYALPEVITRFLATVRDEPEEIPRVVDVEPAP